MSIEYRQKLFSVLKQLVYTADDVEITEKSLVMVTTLSQNLLACGLKLRISDMLSLAKSCSLPTLGEIVKSAVSRRPLPYPEYPDVLMDTASAKARFAQLVHYDTAYKLRRDVPVCVRDWFPTVVHEASAAFPYQVKALPDGRCRFAAQRADDPLFKKPPVLRLVRSYMSLSSLTPASILSSLKNEWRLYHSNFPSQQTDRSLCMAVTLHENLLAMGYRLLSTDLIMLSRYLPDLEYYSCLSNVCKSLPYPKYPWQLMPLEQAKVRLRQLLILDEAFGQTLPKDWNLSPDLPVNDHCSITPRISHFRSHAGEFDASAPFSLSAHIHEMEYVEAVCPQLVSLDEMYQTAFAALAYTRTDYTPDEQRLIDTAIEHISFEHYTSSSTIRNMTTLLKVMARVLESSLNHKAKLSQFQTLLRIHQSVLPQDTDGSHFTFLTRFAEELQKRGIPPVSPDNMKVIHTMMNQKYNTLLLSELRLALYVPGSRAIDEADMVYAATLNENLLSLGYTLTPADLLRLMQSPSRYSFYQTLKDSMGEINAQPMYPDFPKQVMAMDEAQLRFHQLVHYFSTYGLEALCGVKVVKGWLPYAAANDRTGNEHKSIYISNENGEAVELGIITTSDSSLEGGKPFGTEKTVSDTRLLNARVIELVPEEDIHRVVFQKILSKRERMTDKERMLINLALASEKAENLIDGVTVRFKENLMDVFYTIFESEYTSDEKLALLHAICQHTGDVFKCLDFTLTRCRYHLRTSQKKLIVKLLESYASADLRANLVLSAKKAARCITLLSFIDYNTYSRSDEHRQAVADLRDDKLRSWQSRVEKLLADRDDGALAFIASHPGMLVRMCAQLVRLGYAPEKIEEQLLSHAESLSAETLITVLTRFGRMLNREGDFETTFKRSPNAAEKQEQREEFYSFRRRRSRFKPHKVEVSISHDRAEVETVYSIFEKVLFEKLKSLDTPLKDRSVCLTIGQEYALEASSILFNDRSAEGGYMRSGIAYRIPENAKRIRFAVYWDHPTRVDIDLHASAKNILGENVHVGWNADLNRYGITHSGDITHSNAAEYIDIDLTAPLAHATANIQLFSGADSFKDIQTCFVGMMAVDKIDENVALSNPANYFFSHFLTAKCDNLQYGFVDVKNRALIFHGAADEDSDEDYYKPIDMVASRFSMARYLELLMKAQNVIVTENAAQAEISLVMGKPVSDREISLIDQNFFLSK